MIKISDLNYQGKRVFVRADFDVDPNKALNSPRILNLKSTIDFLIEHGADCIILAGHIGRPSFAKASEGKPSIITSDTKASEGKPEEGLEAKLDFFDEKLSTKQLLGALEKVLKRPVTFKDDFENEGSENKSSQIILLENLRFNEGEVENSEDFAKKLALLADIYINEAFGNSHRNHASVSRLPSLLPHAAGLNLQKEVETLTKLLDDPARPFVSIVGGAKLETKIPPIEFLSKIADTVLVGGQLPLEIQKKGLSFSEDVMVAKLTSDEKDISSESTSDFKDVILKAKTVIWNGPLGLYEEGFIKGSEEIAKAIFESGAYSVVGGGETCEFLDSKGLLNQFSFVSSGGGAMLDLLSGKELPGIKALE